MRRVATTERPDWRSTAEANGFSFHTAGEETYWDESAYWTFDLAEIEGRLETPSLELDALCREFMSRAVNDERILARLAIPSKAWDAIRDSWRRGDPSLYGRFDLAYAGEGPAKLLEYNADTPTALYETGVFQWLWLEDMVARGRLPRQADQFNSVHDKLIAAFARIYPARLHLTCMPDAPEDRGTVAYLEDCARHAGLDARFVHLGAIALSGNGGFVDQFGDPIEHLFKLYPWEWMFADDFGAAVGGSPTRFLEPPWKAVLSNKGLLPLLWEMAPGHPNLLAAYFEDDPRKAELGPSFANKPLYSREGANILLVRDAAVLARDDGPYGAEGFIRQELARVAESEGNYAVLGSWIVAGEPAGLCIRESRTAITNNRSRFVPHAIL